MRGHTHSNQAKPRGMQSPVARLTTADPAMPGSGCSLAGSESSGFTRRVESLAWQIAKLQPLGSIPQSCFNAAGVSPDYQKSKVHLLGSLARKPPRSASLLFLYFPYRQAARRTEAGENESQCQILTRQRITASPRGPPPPALALWAGEQGPSPAVEDLFILRSIKGNQALF